ncbi:MAG: siphovirus Gp157 family protein, partial [Pseudolabrys sp.]
YLTDHDIPDIICRLILKELCIPENQMKTTMWTKSIDADDAPSPIRATIEDQAKFAAITYQTIRNRVRAQDPHIDEQTLADTVEGLTDLHEIVAAIVRAALADEALATGLKGRIAEMQDRLERLQDCAAKRRQIAKDVMAELDLKKITAPDFTVSIRPGMPALLVLDEAAVPSIYRDPRLNRQGLLSDLKGGTDINGVALSNPEPVLSVRTK